MLVCGDRKWLTYYNEDGTLDQAKIRTVRAASYRLLDRLAQTMDVDVLIEGCAPGADRMAEDWVYDMGNLGQALIREHLHFPADWDNSAYRTPTGKSFAGNMRNKQMRDEGRPDFVVAFHDNLLESKGTKHMVSLADEAHIPVYGFTLEAVLNADR